MCSFLVCMAAMEKTTVETRQHQTASRGKAWLIQQELRCVSLNISELREVELFDTL